MITKPWWYKINTMTQIIADLHLHSKYSRAVSQSMDLKGIAGWAKKKGINLVATGDWTHPLWFKAIKTELKETAPGIFNHSSAPDVRFLLTTEISSIYSQGDRSRRVHNLIFSPSIAASEKIINQLRSRGANLLSDGRPIVGLSSKNLLELVLEVDKNSLLIPCHVWTPWFSLYGSKSGFDSIEECFGAELSKNIYAVETGLSSDPIMNWQINELENRSIVSFSDAHSGPKLGREATVFTCNTNHETCNTYSYSDIIDAIKQTPNSKLKIGYTIEFFPEEGKYHWTGHRTCNIRYDTKTTKEKGVICPVCHQSLTVGVENRVVDLSSKPINPDKLQYVKNNVGLVFVYDQEKNRRPFVSLVPLLEIITEINEGSSIKALRSYEDLMRRFGTEFDILMKKSYEEIEAHAGNKLRHAIEIVRSRKVFVDPGYDGVFGKVKIFNKQDESPVVEENQPSLF